jgi:hypothetical protein
MEPLANREQRVPVAFMKVLPPVRNALTRLLASGVHPKVASERLGIARSESRSICIPMLSRMQEDAVATVDAALKTALRNRAETNGSNPLAGRIGGTKNE